ncbi:MAG TPA: transcriptional regulator [Terriglobia bacterium]|nr:transcriptional regulator [Terriglobia bacterium]
MAVVAISNSNLTKSDRWIVADPEQFREKFNEKSFEVSHYLATHPLFQLPKLMELADRTLKTRPRDLHYDAGNVRVDQRWDEIAKSPFSAQEALQRVENCGAWFVFSSAQRDSEYRVLLDRGLAEIKALSGPEIDSQIMVEDIIIFVTSPKRITTYHIDRECNFLLQIRGTKTLHVFDREDREVLPEEELEKFWAADFNAAVYKPHLQHRATSYKLRPGMGVHIPVNCPHWVENDDNVSISLSVNFQFKDPLRANAYRANFLLRKLGVHPTPPGQSPVLDTVKSYTIMPVVWAKKTCKRMTA